ncbi:MAG: redox-regulated ATPase YchF [Candidatus Coatesbacteria bacterium]|nr:redox-regulated ATPase YchF [Candidatus Coatesbacteria bacterium]
MKIGIIGMPGSGKTTLFQALTGRKIQMATRKSYSIGQVKVPDSRLEKLINLYKPKKSTFAEIVFLDFNEDAKDFFNPQVIAQIKDSDALVAVLRDFANPLAGQEKDPVKEWQILQSEFMLSDLEIIERKIEKLQKESKAEYKKLTGLFEDLKSCLEQQKPLSELNLTEDQINDVSGFRFLTLLPVINVINIEEENIRNKKSYSLNEKYIEICAKIEADISEMEPEERNDFLKELDIDEPAVDKFIKVCYEKLNLISFFTVGPEEVKAWTIRKGTNTLDAAGKIHSDIKRGFIKAEVMNWEDMIQYGSESALKEAGKLKLEGKNYIIEDGEIVHYRFNV